MRKTPFLVVTALAAAAWSIEACSSQQTSDFDETSERTGAVSEAAIHGSGCPSLGCGDNSPILGPYGMDELSWDGEANADGVRLLAFVKGTKYYDVVVKADRVIAHDRTQYLNTLTGSALKGGYFLVSYPASGTLPAGQAKITVVDVAETVTFWQKDPTTVETLQLDYSGADAPVGRLLPVCKNPPLPAKPQTDLFLSDGHFVPNRYQAILYTGDRYDVKRKWVTADSYASAGHWFNIACAGAALFKMHLNRHTTAATIPGSFETNRDQRQAMLKMYTGDFCGTGEAYTEQGTKIHWKSASGWESPAGNDTSYESFWNKDGATCLTTHRLHNVPDASAPLQDYQAIIKGDGGPDSGDCPARAKPCDPDAMAAFPTVVPPGVLFRTQSLGTP